MQDMLVIWKTRSARIGPLGNQALHDGRDQCEVCTHTKKLISYYYFDGPTFQLITIIIPTTTIEPWRHGHRALCIFHVDFEMLNII